MSSTARFFPILLAAAVSLGAMATSLAQEDRSERPWLGVTLAEPEPPLAQSEQGQESLGAESVAGVLITGVAKGSPADEAELRAGDIVLTVDGLQVASTRELIDTIGSLELGDWVLLELSRRGETKRVSARLGPRPERISRLELKRGWGGIVPVDVPLQLQEFWGGEGTQAVLVGAVVPGGPADRAGLLPGDLVVSVDGRPVRSASDLIRRVGGGGIGNELLIEVSRQGTWLEVELTVDEEPPREELEDLEDLKEALPRGSRR